MRVPYADMKAEFIRVLEKNGIHGEDADLCARLFADASRDGIETHGLNRFPAFITAIRKGLVDPAARATRVEGFGPLERWDGNRGPGNLNAYIAMSRAIEMAKENTVGIVALRNNNHWMRPGNYGLMAVENDCIGILWTNTIPNMPAWGGKDARIGNNPLVLAIPYKDTPVMVDMAMSMFSNGKLEKLAREGKTCPVDAGRDREGKPSRDPAAVFETKEHFPIGFWKGSSLSILLDLIASSLAGGKTVRAIGDAPMKMDADVCQVFLCISLSSLPDREDIEREIGKSLEYIKASEPVAEGMSVRYPGEGMIATRRLSMEKGVNVDEKIWEEVKAL